MAKRINHRRMGVVEAAEILKARYGLDGAAAVALRRMDADSYEARNFYERVEARLDRERFERAAVRETAR